MKNRTLSTLLFTATILLFSPTYGQFVTTIHDSNSQRFTDGLALNSEGAIYCSDFLGSNVYKRNLDGIVTVFAGGFTNPNGLAFDSESNLFVCDNGANRIIKFTSEGIPLDTFPVLSPSGIIKSFASDTMIFSQYFTNGLNTLAPDGSITQTHVGGVLNGPIGLAMDDIGQLYVGNFNDREIYRVFDDSLLYVATVPGPSNGWLSFITYGDGTLWGTSFDANSIYRISTDAVDETVLYSGSTMGNDDGPIATATFSRPNGIITSSGGDTIYVSQYVTGELRMISPAPSSLTHNNLDEPQFSVYPNPSNEFVRIARKGVEGRIEISDATGRVVLATRDSTEEIVELDLSTLDSGVYTVTIVNDNSRSPGQVLLRM